MPKKKQGNDFKYPIRFSLLGIGKYTMHDVKYLPIVIIVENNSYKFIDNKLSLEVGYI